MNESIVYIVDDDSTAAESAEVTLVAAGMVLRTFHSAEEFMQDCLPHESACLILDLRMPGMTGMELIERLRARHVEMPVIVLSGHADIPAVVECMKLGAAEFLLKPADTRILVKRVRELLQSNALRCEERAKTQEIRDNFATLTGRELELVELISAGLSSKQIAVRMGITLKTVENHRSHMLAKTRAPNVASLVRMKMIAANRAAVA